MSRTLLLYDGKMSSTERVADTLGCLIGNCRIAELGDAHFDFGEYDGVCLIFNFYGAVTAGRPRNFFIQNKDLLIGKRLACVGVGFSDAGYSKFVLDLERQTGLGAIAGYFITRENETPRTGYDIGRIMRAPVSVMPENDLERAIDDFIISHNTMALATADGSFVRCTPLEYIYKEKLFYVITEGGNKCRGILGNGRISAAIYEQYTSMDSVEGLQITGRAELVPNGGAEYMSVMAEKNITEDILAALPVRLYVVRVTPYTYEFTDSAFARDGYDARQVLNTKFRRAGFEAGAQFAVAQESAGAAAAPSGDSGTNSEEKTSAVNNRERHASAAGDTAETPSSIRQNGETKDISPAESGKDISLVPPLEAEPKTEDVYRPERHFVVNDRPSVKNTDEENETGEADGSGEGDSGEEKSTEKKVDEYGLPVLDMSVIEGLYPSENTASYSSGQVNPSESGAASGSMTQDMKLTDLSGKSDLSGQKKASETRTALGDAEKNNQDRDYSFAETGDEDEPDDDYGEDDEETGRPSRRKSEKKKGGGVLGKIGRAVGNWLNIDDGEDDEDDDEDDEDDGEGDDEG